MVRPQAPGRAARRAVFRPRPEAVEGRVLMTIFGPDNRVPVADTAAYPYSAVVRIAETFPDGYKGFGTGEMIDANHVLTCAHILYKAAEGGWADSVTVTPGQEGGSAPFGAVAAVRETTYTPYVAGRNSHYDIAVLQLAAPIGDETGWFGMKAEPDAFFRGATVQTAGYPNDIPRGTPDRGRVMVTQVGATVSADATQIRHRLDTWSGQSGSPIWQDQKGDFVVLAVHIRGHNAHDRADSTRYNTAVRLTPATIADVKTWASIGGPRGPRLRPVAGQPGTSALAGRAATAETHALGAA